MYGANKQVNTHETVNQLSKQNKEIGSHCLFFNLLLSFLESPKYTLRVEMESIFLGYMRASCIATASSPALELLFFGSELGTSISNLLSRYEKIRTEIERARITL